MRILGVAIALLIGAAAHAAETGGLLRLGETYLEGELVAYDPALALRHFSAAAENGDTTATLRLAEMTMRGLGVERDIEAGLQSIRRLVDDGSLSAQVSLGDAYARGYAGTVDPAAALDAYERAAAGGRTEAMMRLSDIHRYGLFGRAQPETAFRYLADAREAGNPDALALMGRGLVEADFGRAGSRADGVEMLREAERLGSEDAAVTLATSRITGEGFPRSVQGGIADLEAAAESGSIAAALRLVEIFRTGRKVGNRTVVRRDLSRARAYLQDVVDRLDPGERASQDLLMDVAAARRGEYGGLYESIMTTGPRLRPGLAQRILRTDANAFVHAVQVRLAALGHYSGSPDGLMTRRTIAAVYAYCAQLDARSLCRNGPLSPQTTHLLFHAF